MITEKGSGSRVWLVMMVLAVLFTVWTALTLTSGDTVLEHALTMFTDSTLEVSNLDEATSGFLTMAMLKPLWEEIWIGVLGIFCALGLKHGNKYAWILGVFWGVMMLANGLIQGGYELFILKWSMVCPQAYIFLVLGVIALISLLVTRKAYFFNQR